MNFEHKGMPIFYFHKGSSYYLQYTINQTKKYNPDSEIIFLGDDSNEYVKDWGVTHVKYHEYFDMAQMMADSYVHLNNNSPEIELLCMQRWLCCAEYVQKRGIEGPFVLLDSDVLLYCDITEYASKYMGNADMSVCGKYCGPGYVIFKDALIAMRLAKGLLSWYIERDKKKKLYFIRKELEKAGNTSNVINDVKLLELVCKEEKFFLHDMTVIIDSQRFDTHIARDEPCFPVGKKGIKNIVMKQGVPYSTNVLDGSQIRFLSLHFQGGHKMRMFQFYSGDSAIVQSKAKGYAMYYFQLLKRKAYFLMKAVLKGKK